MPLTITAVTVAAAVFFGASTQRLTGMGFALVSAPALVLVLGAGTGVPLIQVLGFLVSLSILVASIRMVAWVKVITLLAPALVGIIPGWWLARTVPAPMLLIVIGLMVLVAILAVVADSRARVFKGTAGLIGAGFLSGFMNVTAGIGGPAVVLYKLSTDWDHTEFVATVQAYFMALNLGSLLALGFPVLPADVWWSALVALVAGIGAGHLLAARVSPRFASRLVVLVALLGAVSTIIQGLIELWGDVSA